MKWTPEQEQILREFGNRGAAYCRNLIFKRFNVYRSISATERHASRIMASMAQIQICPMCGRVVRKLNRNSGICEVCNYDRLWREQIEEEKRLVNELKRGGDEVASSNAKRRYDAQRRKVARVRAQVCADFVDLSRKMSISSSERQKKSQDPPEKEKRAQLVGA